MSIKTLSDLLDSKEYDSYRFGSSSDDWINDPDRMQRCHDAAEDGGDGSTHSEHIEDWRQCLNNCFDDLDDETRDSIENEINECEQWHIENESIDEIIG